MHDLIVIGAKTNLPSKHVGVLVLMCMSMCCGDCAYCERMLHDGYQAASGLAGEFEGRPARSETLAPSLRF